MLIVLSYTALSAQTSDIEIKVISEPDAAPLPGATLYIEALEKGTITDLDGLGILTDLPDGTHRLVISYIGYGSLETTLTTPGVSRLMFRLQPADNQLEEVAL